MSTHFLRRAAALAAVSALVLAGCSDDTSTATSTESGDTETTAAAEPTYDSAATTCEDVEQEPSALDVVTVGGELGTAPTLSFSGDLEVTEDVFTVVCEGDGDVITEGDLAWYLARAETSDGTSMYLSTSATYLTVDSTPVSEGGVVGLTIGTRILMGFENDGTPVAQVVELVDRTAADDIVTDVAADAAGVPTVAFADDAAPTITLPDDFTTPTGIQRIVLEEGDGDVVEITDTVNAHYIGVQGSDGTEFDSSWVADEPVAFSLQSVITGWTYGLEGLTAGTTVMLIIPPAFGYGASTTSELATETLVFVVEIVSINDTETTETTE